MKLWIGIGTTLLVGASTYAFCPPKQGQSTVVGTGNGVCVVAPSGTTLRAGGVQFGGQVLTAANGVTITTPGVATTTFGACATACPPNPPRASVAGEAPKARSLEAKINEQLARKAADRAMRTAERARVDATRARSNALRAKVDAERSALRARRVAPQALTAEVKRITEEKIAQLAEERTALAIDAENLAKDAAALAEARVVMGDELKQLSALGYLAGDAASAEDALVVLGEQLSELSELGDVADGEGCADACTEACTEACEEACAEACEAAGAEACDEACAAACEEACEEACAEACEDACDTVTVVEGVDMLEAPQAIIVEGHKVSVAGQGLAPKARVARMKVAEGVPLAPIAPGAYRVAAGKWATQAAGPMGTAGSAGSAHGEHEAILVQLKMLTDEIRALREEVRAMHAASRITETY